MPVAPGVRRTAAGRFGSLQSFNAISARIASAVDTTMGWQTAPAGEPQIRRDLSSHPRQPVPTRRNEIKQELSAKPTSPIRLHPNLAQVYRRQVERLQHALNDPEIRDEAIQILRGLVELVSIRPVKDGLEIEIVGEIAKMVELGIGTRVKQAALDDTATRSVKVVAGTGFVQERTKWELRRTV